jgi:hypothetical protein
MILIEALFLDFEFFTSSQEKWYKNSILSESLTRGHAVRSLWSLTQMPPLILYDDKMIHFVGCGGTSHVREPLNSIEKEGENIDNKH